MKEVAKEAQPERIAHELEGTEQAEPELVGGPKKAERDTAARGVRGGSRAENVAPLGGRYI